MTHSARTPAVPALARALAQAYVDGGLPNLPVILPPGTQVPGAEERGDDAVIPARRLVEYLDREVTP